MMNRSRGFIETFVVLGRNHLILIVMSFIKTMFLFYLTEICLVDSIIADFKLDLHKYDSV